MKSTTLTDSEKIEIVHRYEALSNPEKEKQLKIIARTISLTYIALAIVSFLILQFTNATILKNYYFKLTFALTSVGQFSTIRQKIYKKLISKNKKLSGHDLKEKIKSGEYEEWHNLYMQSDKASLPPVEELQTKYNKIVKKYIIFHGIIIATLLLIAAICIFM